MPSLSKLLMFFLLQILRYPSSLWDLDACFSLSLAKNYSYSSSSIKISLFFLSLRIRDTKFIGMFRTERIEIYFVLKVFDQPFLIISNDTTI